MGEDLEKFIEHYPTYIDAIEIIDNYKKIFNFLNDEIYKVLLKNKCKEKIYVEIGEIFDKLKKDMEKWN